MERINSLRFTSFFGVFSICYLVFATVYHSTNTMIQEGFDVTWGEAKLINFNIIVPRYFECVSEIVRGPNEYLDVTFAH